MKRTIVFFVLILLIVSAASADQFILTGQWSLQGNDDDVISAAKAGQVMHLGGIGTEMRFHHVGIGSALLMNITETGADQWVVNGDLRAYLSYHFFRPHAFLDPYIQAGGGVYGDFSVYGDACDGTLMADDSFNLGFYPYLAAGLGLRFRGGLYASGQFNWRPTTGSVPCCDTIGTPEAREYEVVFALGYSFGDRR